MADFDLYKVNLDTPQPNGRLGESPRAAFAKYNDALDAIGDTIDGSGQGQMISDTEPDNPIAYMVWIDTSSAPAITKVRNADNDGWVTVGETLAPLPALGTAAYVNTGTESGDVPTNSDLGTAAYVNTGTESGDVPTNSDLGAAATRGVHTGGGNPSSNDVLAASPENIEINRNGSGNRGAYIDFHSKDGVDFCGRILKNSGNGAFDIAVLNGGIIQLVAEDVAKQILFNRSGDVGASLAVIGGNGAGTATWMGMYHSASSALGDWFHSFSRAGNWIGSISSATSSSVAFNTASDYRLKESESTIANAVETISKLSPYNFTWKLGGESDQGFFAHELQEVLPHVVTGEKDAVDDEGKIKPQQVDYSKMVPLLVAGIQELSVRLCKLEGK